MNKRIDNRQIKFRIWDKSNKNFIYNGFSKSISGEVLLGLDGSIRIAQFPCGNGDNSADSVFDKIDCGDNFVIQQFTGIKDKNDRDIYEGDVIVFYDDMGEFTYIEKISEPYTVVYDENESSFKAYKEAYGNLCETCRPLFSSYQTKCEIIGNIF